MSKSIITGVYPATRMRRVRQHEWARRLVRESKPSPDDIVWGMIVHDGKEPRVPVKTMPGVDRLNVDEAAKAAVRARELGIPAIAIFPHINADKKNEGGDEAVNAGWPDPHRHPGHEGRRPRSRHRLRRRARPLHQPRP